MTLEALVGEETILTLLTVQWRSVVDHLRVNLNKIDKIVKCKPSSRYSLPEITLTL